MANSTFDRVPRGRVPRSMQDLSNSKLFDGDIGILYPVQVLECYPGDIFSLAHEIVVRFMPLIRPILHKITVHIHNFFVPHRLTWPEVGTPPTDGFELFITGGEDGTATPTIPEFAPTSANRTIGFTWDHLGFPPLNTGSPGAMPKVFPARSYMLIYNEWYRDQNIIDPLDITDDNECNTLRKRSWAKDYFTTMMASQQRGTSPSLPVTLSGVFDVDPVDAGITVKNDQDATSVTMSYNSGTNPSVDVTGNVTSGGYMRWIDPQLHVDAANITATTFDINTLRLSFAQQRIMERSQRTGARYPEYLLGAFNTIPADARVQRPEYIGGMAAPVVMSEVLQTAATDTGTSSQTPQGNLAGHAISVDRGSAGRYRCREHGTIMSILSVTPRAVYGQGMAKNWTRETRWDFYDPQLAHLSEQAVYERELRATATEAHNKTILGYQAIWNELRYEPSRYAGKMRVGQSMDHWHMGRKFSARPGLNTTLIEIEHSDFDRCFAVTSESQMVIHVGNATRALRPIPAISDPGLARM